MIERRRVPRRTSRIGTGGAIVLAGLIAVVLAVAVVAGGVTVRQLSAAASESQLIFEVEQGLDALVRVQLDEETSLRGYLIAGHREFLQPFASGLDPFAEGAAALDRRLRETDLAQGRVFLRQIVALHQTWRAQVAGPLVKDRSPRSISRRESLGKLLNDRLSRQARAFREFVSAKNDDVQATLARKIKQTVEYAIGFVLVFALAGLYLTIAQHNTASALERQHSIAASLQAALGVGWQAVPGSTIGTAYVSATRESDVGGDLFDAWRLDEGCGAIVIADMSGKGIDAVVNTAFCKYSIRALFETHVDPADVMTEFNRLFARTIDDPSLFAVAFLGVLDARTGTFRYVSAGHEAAYLRRGGTVKQLEIGGPIVGMLPDSTYSASTQTLEVGEMIVLSTDGLTEARDVRGEMLGAGAKALIAHGPTDPQALCDMLVAAVRERAGGTISDDLALLALRFDGGQAQPVAETA